MEPESWPTKHELLSLTGETLKDISDDRVTDLVTLIRGYQELFELFPERPDYLEDVAYHMLALADIVLASGREDLAKRLRNFVLAIGSVGTSIPTLPQGTDLETEINQVFCRLRAAHRNRVDEVVENGELRSAAVTKVVTTSR